MNENHNKNTEVSSSAERRRISWKMLLLSLVGLAVFVGTIGFVGKRARDSRRPSGTIAGLETKGDLLRPSAYPTLSPVVDLFISSAPSGDNHREGNGENSNAATAETLASAFPSNAPEPVSSDWKPHHPDTLGPTGYPTPKPTVFPTSLPSAAPALKSTSVPSLRPSASRTVAPTSHPTPSPTAVPSISSADIDSLKSSSPQPSQFNGTYIPGDLTVSQVGLSLSTGLKARILARAGEPVEYESTGKVSSIPFHELPDAAAVFEDHRPGNEGGWIYVSNSEVRQPHKKGGVGAITFNKHGRIIDYRMIQEGTTANCGGGKTPWGTWVTCEEYRMGVIFQVDPLGIRPPEQLTVGSEGGLFESFAYDARHSHYFVTEDHRNGTLRRFIPYTRNPDDPWQDLHGDGEIKHLRLIPASDTRGKYEWTFDKPSAELNANMFYPNAEGIDVYRNELYFVSKVLKTLFILNLDSDTYTSHSTRRGLFDGQPDQLKRLIGKPGSPGDGLLYFTEDGGRYAGIHARDTQGRFFTILESPEYADETTGLAFSPNGKHMYIAYQDNGILFEITREDGLPFYARSLNIKYHATGGGIA